MSRGKKRMVLVAGTIIVIASMITVLFVTNGNNYNSITVVAETEKSSYHYGETVNITLRTVMSNADFYSNKTVGLWVARIPDQVNPEKIIGNQGALASMIVSQDAFHGGYRCHLSVSKFSTSSNLSLVWNGTVDGPLDPFEDWSHPQNTTYRAPAGYYLVYGERENPASNVALDYRCDEHSIFYLDGIEPRVNWTYDSSSREVAFGVNVTSATPDSTVNFSLRAAAQRVNNSYTHWNESASLLPGQNVYFNFILSNVSLSEPSDMVWFTTIIDTDNGRFFVYCLAHEHEAQVDWVSYGA